MSAMFKSAETLWVNTGFTVITDDDFSTEPLPATGESVGADFGMEGRFFDT